jgi:hypothetical protein
MSPFSSSQFKSELNSNIDLELVMDIVTDPTITWKQFTGMNIIPYGRDKFFADVFRNNNWIRVVFEPNGRGILTAFLLDSRDGEQYAHPPLVAGRT